MDADLPECIKQAARDAFADVCVLPSAKDDIRAGKYDDTTMLRHCFLGARSALAAVEAAEGWRPIDDVMPEPDDLLIVAGFNGKRQWCADVWCGRYLVEHRAQVAAGVFDSAPHLKACYTLARPLPAPPAQGAE